MEKRLLVFIIFSYLYCFFPKTFLTLCVLPCILLWSKKQRIGMADITCDQLGELRNACKRLQYSKSFLLSRKCKTEDMTILKDIDIDVYLKLAGPFTEKGIKTILYLRNSSKGKRVKEFRNKRTINIDFNNSDSNESMKTNTSLSEAVDFYLSKLNASFKNLTPVSTPQKAQEKNTLNINQFKHDINNYNSPEVTHNHIMKFSSIDGNNGEFSGNSNFNHAQYNHPSEIFKDKYKHVEPIENAFQQSQLNKYINMDIIGVANCSREKEFNTTKAIDSIDLAKFGIDFCSRRNQSTGNYENRDLNQLEVPLDNNFQHSYLTFKDMDTIRSDFCKREKELKENYENKLDNISKYLEKKYENSLKKESELLCKKHDEILKRETIKIRKEYEETLKVANDVLAMKEKDAQDAQNEIKRASEEIKSLSEQLGSISDKLDQTSVLNGILEERLNVLNNDLELKKLLMEEEKEKMKKEHIEEMKLKLMLFEESEEKREKDLTEMIEDTFECAICNEVLIDGIILSCSHSFCKYCINEWSSSQNGAQLCCPNCRRVYQVNDIRSYSTFQSLFSKVEHMLTDEFSSRRSRIVDERRSTRNTTPEDRTSSFDFN